MPIVNGLEREYGSRISFIYVSQDEEAGRETAREYGVVGTPTLLFLNEQGEPVQVLRGAHPEPILERAIEDLLSDEG